MFLDGLHKYGSKGLKEIAEYLGGSRTVVQVRSHLQKHIIKEHKRTGLTVKAISKKLEKNRGESGEVVK